MAGTGDIGGGWEYLEAAIARVEAALSEDAEWRPLLMQLWTTAVVEYQERWRIRLR